MFSKQTTHPSVWVPATTLTLGRGWAWWRALAVGVVLWGGLAAVWAQTEGAAGLVLTVREPVLNAEPGTVVSVAARLANASEQPIEGVPGLELPERWSLLVAPETLRLAPNEARVTLLAFAVPGTARAGTYPLRLRYEAPGLGPAAADLTVTVATRRSLSVALLDAPRVALADYTARFRVRNDGNVAETVTLMTSDNLGLVTRVVGEVAIRLEPAETRTVEVAVTVPADTLRSASQQLELSAFADGLQARARAAVDLVAERLDERAAQVLFPLQLELSSVLSSGRFEQGVFAQNGLLDGSDIRLSGRGPLYVGDPGRLDLDLSRQRQFASYRRDALRVSLGEQSLSLSPLTALSLGRRDVGFGVEVRPVEGVVLELVGAAPEDDESARLGGRVGVRVGETFGVSGHYLWQPERQSALLSTRFQLATRAALANRPTVSLDGELATDAGALGVWLLYRIVGEPVSVGAQYRSLEAGFAGAPTTSDRFVLGGGLDLRRTLDTPFVPRLDIRLEAERSALGGASVYERAFEARVVGDLGPLAYRVDYDADDRSGAATSERDLRFGVSFPLTSSVASEQRLSYTLSRRNAQTLRRQLGYEGLVRIGLEPQWTPRWGLEYDLIDADVAAEVGLAWRGALTPRLPVGLGAGVRVDDGLRFSLTAQGVYRYPSGSVLQAAFEGAVGAGSPRVSLRLAQQIPLDVSLGARADIAVVRGRVLTRQGEGQAGVVVRLAGQALLTDSDGRFLFPAVPVGTQTLEVDPPTPLLLSDPSTPLRLELSAGEQVEQIIRLLPAAALEARVEVLRPELGENEVYTAAQLASDDDIVRGVGLELRRATDQRIATFGSSDRLSFAPLLPGDWTLVVRGVPSGFEADAPSTITVSPDAVTSVQIRLVAIPRTLQIIDGGEVTPTPPQQP